MMESDKGVLTFESVDEILWCGHSNKTSSAILSHDTICFSAFNKIEFRLWPLLLTPTMAMRDER